MLEDVAAGTAIATQIEDDCRTAACDGEGNLISLIDDEDVRAEDDACARDRCVDGNPMHFDLPAGTACEQDDGRFCDGRGACVECRAPSDCPGELCELGRCRPLACANSELDADETDVDCGGACSPCALDAACTLDTDCESAFCNPVLQRCAQPSCSDAFRNGTETGIDCGGGCAACAMPCEWNDHCSPGDVCYLGSCTHTVNGCSIGSATNLTRMASVEIAFGGVQGAQYLPRCAIVTMDSQVTFSGDFAVDPLVGGHVRLGAKLPVSNGPFVPATNAGTSKTVTMSECSTFGFYSDTRALDGMTGAIFVVAP